MEFHVRAGSSLQKVSRLTPLVVVRASRRRLRRKLNMPRHVLSSSLHSVLHQVHWRFQTTLVQPNSGHADEGRARHCGNIWSHVVVFFKSLFLIGCLPVHQYIGMPTRFLNCCAMPLRHLHPSVPFLRLPGIQTGRCRWGLCRGYTLRRHLVLSWFSCRLSGPTPEPIASELLQIAWACGPVTASVSCGCGGIGQKSTDSRGNCSLVGEKAYAPSHLGKDLVPTPSPLKVQPPADPFSTQHPAAQGHTRRARLTDGQGSSQSFVGLSLS